jgi:hypothetical protein
MVVDFKEKEDDNTRKLLVERLRVRNNVSNGSWNHLTVYKSILNDLMIELSAFILDEHNKRINNHLKQFDKFYNIANRTYARTGRNSNYWIKARDELYKADEVLCYLMQQEDFFKPKREEMKKE